MTAIPTSSFLCLHQRGLIRVGETLFFKYQDPQGKNHIFEAIVSKTGLELEGKNYNPSFAAMKCLQKINQPIAVNGWLVWRNKKNLSLAELYKIRLGYPHAHSNEVLHPALPLSLASRDVVFILGAGVASDKGSLLQKHILPKLFCAEESDSFLLESIQFKAIKDFMQEFFYYDRIENPPDLEYIFSFIEYFLAKKESLNAEYSYNRLLFIKESLIRLIYYMVMRFTGEASAILKKFWQLIYEKNRNISIITVNYNTAIEDAFSFLYPLNCYLDLTVDILNYDYNIISPRDIWINPQKPILIPKNEQAFAFKLIKIHGSLKWLYCNCCNSLLVRPWNSENIHDILTQPSIAHANPLLCPRDNTQFQTLIAPPAHQKDLSHPVITQLLIEANNEIRAANTIIFIGYSMPEADIHIRALLARNNLRTKKIIVINPLLHEEQKRRFLQLNEQIQFIEESFEKVLEQGILAQLITS